LRSIGDAGKGITLSLVHEGPIEAVQGMNFYDPDGQAIDAQLTGRFDPSLQGNRGTATLNYTLPVNPDSVQVEVRYVEQVETVTIPIELQVDVGTMTLGTPTTAPAEPVRPQGSRLDQAEPAGRRRVGAAGAAGRAWPPPDAPIPPAAGVRWPAE